MRFSGRVRTSANLNLREIDSVFTQPFFNRKNVEKRNLDQTEPWRVKTKEVAFTEASRDPSIKNRVVFSIRNDLDDDK